LSALQLATTKHPIGGHLQNAERKEKNAVASFRASMVGFDITPRIHPTCGAWGSTHTMTEVDMPLLSRCLLVEQDGRRLLWYGSDLVGDHVRETDVLRQEIAEATGLDREQVLWSTSQTHSSGAVPGSEVTGSVICDLSRQDPAFMEAERRRFVKACIDAAREAATRLEPVTVAAGRGYCDTASYNTRLVLPNGKVKFSRHHAEGLQGGGFFDPTIGLVRFDDAHGHPVGVIFNFCAHPATMIDDKMISPDWVGTARQCIEEALGGAPAMYIQGFCGDVNCHHLFGTPQQARRTGARLGSAAVEALGTLIPARSAPFIHCQETIELPRQPMPTLDQFEHEMAIRKRFLEDLAEDPYLTWCAGWNLPEYMTPEKRARIVDAHFAYLQKGLEMLARGEEPGPAIPILIGAVRLGDLAFFWAPGEIFASTGLKIRQISPFVHTLICGDTNGLVGYIGPDEEIERGGAELEWKWLYSGEFRLPPAKGSTGRILAAASSLLTGLHRERVTET
jgi:hypothetical protein